MKWITSSTKPNIINKDEIWHPLLNIKYLNPIIPKTVDIAIFTSKHGIVDCKINEKFAIGQNGIKNVADITDKLADLHKKMKDLNDDYQGPKSITNNALYVGSTADLLQLIKQEKKMSSAE